MFLTSTETRRQTAARTRFSTIRSTAGPYCELPTGSSAFLTNCANSVTTDRCRVSTAKDSSDEETLDARKLMPYARSASPFRGCQVTVALGKCGMINRQEREVYLVVAVRSAEAGALDDVVGTVLEDLRKHPELETIPVHWHLPSVALEQFDRTYPRTHSTLRMRLATGDMLLPSGFGGGSHVLLLPEDVVCETEWAFSNPWGSGVADVFETPDRVIMPTVTDWWRVSVRKIYTTGRTVCLLESRPPGRSPNACRIHVVGGKGTLAELPVIHQYADGGAALLRALKRCTSTRAGGAMVVATKDSLPRLLASLSRVPKHKRRVRIVSLRGMLRRLSAETTLGSQRMGRSRNSNELLHQRDRRCGIRASATPIDHFRLSGVGYSRDAINESLRRARSGEGTAGCDRNKSSARRLLLGTSPFAETASRMESGPPPLSQERVLIADMNGSVVLEDESMSAYFTSGRLSGMEIEGTRINLEYPAQTFFRVDGRMYRCVPAGAYSFEGDGTRGLRSRLVTDIAGTDRPTTVIVDHIFAEGYPHLFISVDVTYPPLSSEQMVNAFALFEMSIRTRVSARDTASEVRARYPNGEYADGAQIEEDGSRIYYGTSFTVTPDADNTHIFVAFPETESTRIHRLSVRRSGRLRRPILRLNPGGSYGSYAGDCFRGIREHVLLAVGGGSGKSSRILPPSTDILDRVGRPWVRDVSPTPQFDHRY